MDKAEDVCNSKMLKFQAEISPMLYPLVHREDVMKIIESAFLHGFTVGMVHTGELAVSAINTHYTIDNA